MAALRAANAQLGELRRGQGEDEALVAAVEAFLARGRASGALLAEDDDRWSAQGLLDYWASALERLGRPAPEATLAEFDPLLAPELPDEACPYLGLDAFGEGQAELFFGRRRVVAELLEKLEAQRLIAVVGPSGSGKSSVVRAGLLPALRDGALPGSAGWDVLPPIVPGSDPLAALAGVGSWGLEKTQPPTPNPQLLIIDQFEETFTLCGDEAQRRAFIARVVAWATDAAGGRVVLTMRSDFEPFVARAEALLALYDAGKVALPPLSAGEMREAIERPAAQAGLKFEAGVVDALLGDILGEPAALPLLQYSLLKLWEARERNRVTLETYRRVGGGRLALARGADAVYNSLIPEDQDAAQRILLRLVRLDEGLEVTSSRVRRSELNRGGEDPGRVERVLHKLVDARLLRLTAGERPEDSQVEVAHEALVRNWPALVEWLEDGRKKWRQRQRLKADAKQWEDLGRDPTALLAGQLLQEARDLLTDTPDDDDLITLVREFVQAGADAEEAQARRAARTSQVIMALAVLATIFGLVATVLAVQASAGRAQAERDRNDAIDARQTSEANRYIAEGQRVLAEAAQSTAEAARAETERQRGIINIQRLVFAAQTQFRDSPETGLLLAYEASAREDNALTNQSIRNAIEAALWQPLVLRGHEGAVYSAVYSADGSRIVTASQDGAAKVWDTSGNVLATLREQEDTEQVTRAIFSPDGSRILTASTDDIARLWYTSGALIARLAEHTGDIRSVAFSADGSHILTSSDDGTARLWDADGQFLVSFDAHSGPVWKAVFSPDGARVLTSSSDGTAHLWSLDGQALVDFVGHTSTIYSVAFNGDGTRILTASQDETVRLWDTSGATLATFVGHKFFVEDAMFSPDGSLVLTASGDSTARLWKLDGSLVAVLKGHKDAVSAVFSPNGRQILTASGDGDARLWDLNGQTIAILQGHTDVVNSARFSPDGGSIVTASWDHTARLWSQSGEPLATLIAHSGPVMSAVYSPDGARILTASDDHTARLWDLSGAPLTTLEGHTDAVLGASFSPDGTRILTVSRDATARLWDADGTPLKTLEGHTGWVLSGVFSPDGTRILTASDDHTARIWGADGALLAMIEGHPDYVYSATFSPDGKYILTSSRDETARLSDSEGAFIIALKGHIANLTNAIFSPDSTRILTTSRDGTARLWDTSGQAIATLGGHTDWIYNAIFSPDGARILTASRDGTARQYLVYSEDLRKAAACRVGRGLTPEEIARFQVPAPLTFNLDTRVCPPMYSWE